MRSPILPLLVLLSACSFPVDEFAVTDGGAKDGAATDTSASVVQDTAPPPGPSTSASADAGVLCQCIEYKGIDCKRWFPDKCGEK